MKPRRQIIRVGTMLGLVVLAHACSTQPHKPASVAITADASATTRPAKVVDASPIPRPAFTSFEPTKPEVLAAVKKRGANTAANDIKAGKLRILVYGGGGAPKDPETGYPTMPVDCCDDTGQVFAEADAYNQVMRGWHEKHH